MSPPDPDGVVEIVHAGLTDAFPAASVLLDLGPKDRARRVRYDVVDGTLRSLDLATPGAAPNPLASDIVNMKLQYGVDTDDDGFLDTWVRRRAAPWDPASLLAAPAATLAQIKAIRLGLIVTSETFDRAVPPRSTGCCSIANTRTRRAARDASQARCRRTGAIAPTRR